MVRGWKINDYILIYWTTFSNTFGSVMEIVTNKNAPTFLWKFGTIYGNANGNPW